MSESSEFFFFTRVINKILLRFGHGARFVEKGQKREICRGAEGDIGQIRISEISLRAMEVEEAAEVCKYRVVFLFNQCTICTT